MTLQNEVLWHLRIYGPCGIAKLHGTTRKTRPQVISAMNRLREIGLAEWREEGVYRITPHGERHLSELGTPLLNWLGT
jgi:DNA-binding IclR family transcriptional regulator